MDNVGASKYLKRVSGQSRFTRLGLSYIKRKGPNLVDVANRENFLLASSPFDKKALLERRLRAANQDIREARKYIEEIPYSKPHAPTGLSRAGEQAQELLTRAANTLVEVLTLEALILKEWQAEAQMRIKEMRQGRGNYSRYNLE